MHPETLRAWDRWQDRPRIERVLREIEREWGLRRVPGRLAEVERGEVAPREGPGLTPGQQAQVRHRAAEPQVVAWRRELSPEFEAARSWSDLAVRLQVNGVHLQARGRGLVVTDGEVYVKASSLGREYSRGRLEERFGQGFAEWRETRERFRAAAETYARYAHRAPGNPRARAALRGLRSAGESLGWRAASRLVGPLAPAVRAAVVAASRAQARGSSREAWEGLLAERVVPALRRSSSWMEVEGRLRRDRVWIESGRSGGARRSRELVVTDGERATRLRDLGPELAPGRLRERLGSWGEWQRTGRRLLWTARRLHRHEGRADEEMEAYRRTARLIRVNERRVERYQELRDHLRVAEWRLERLLEPQLPRRSRPGAASRLVRELRDAPEEEVAGRLRAGISAFRSWWLRKEVRPEEVDQALRRYRDLAREVARIEPAARSAGKRIPKLRRRAWRLDPEARRIRLHQDLERLAWRITGVGLRALLSRAAPGLGPAMNVLGIVRRLVRRLELEREGGRER